MAEAKRDGNLVTTLLAVSSADGVTPVVVWADPVTHRLLVQNSGGSTPGGSDTQVQFNDAGTLAGDAGFTYDKTTDTVTVAGPVLMQTARLADSNASHYLVLTASSDLTANRVFSLVTGDAARSLTMAGNINVAADFITSGANSLTLTTTGATNVTLPTSGTLITNAVTALNSLTSATSLPWTGMATGTDGQIPTFDSSGNPAFVATGTAGHVLTSNGAGAAPTFQAPAGGGATTALDNLAAVAINAALLPGADNTIALGDATHNWSDLFLGTGALINFDNGNAVITHSSGILTVSTGDWRVTTAGTNAASVVTVGGTQTLANKTLTTPVLGVATATSINGLTITTSTGTLTIANGKTLTISNTLTFAGTDGQTFTFPNGSDTVVTLAATQTLSAKTLTAPIIGGTAQFAENAAIAYDAASSADGAYSGFVRAGTAGATLAFGDLIYLAAADSRWELADADAASTSGDVMLGMCVLAAAADADPTTVLMVGFIRADAVFPAMTISAPLYVGTTAGDIQTAQPSGTDDVIRRVGFAWTADELYFNPSNDYITHT